MSQQFALHSSSQTDLDFRYSKSQTINLNMTKLANAINCFLLLIIQLNSDPNASALKYIIDYTDT